MIIRQGAYILARVKNTRSQRYDGKTQDHSLDSRYEDQKLIALLITPYPKIKSVFDQ